ncbi:aldo/keto reductase [Alloscardovia theropitheci]|uniref:Aldo/keto reductase n=1 Tax=Alloscardovia theropitheci TaxID=2496842 RepID=A0A4R0QYK1_9BIFI|nr:aldo/keto reductase [Alloscardovia theropitheci]TCD53556.1 aldo/keto reductase [Alloscardovia theropitheci]
MEYIKLNSGYEMPILGFGTYQIPPSDTKRSVENAIEVGYRHIDTAQVYRNEEGVGRAVEESNIPREEFFITSKVQTDGYDETMRGLEESFRKLRTDYVDLFIIHWPMTDSLGSYRALEQFVKDERIRSIGLSNFNHLLTQEIIDNAEIKPVINQIETHMRWQQQKMHAYLTSQDIVHESWSPLGQGQGGILTDPAIARVAEKYGKSVPQTILRYLIQENIVVIPKASSKEHALSNFEVFDFSLSDEDRDELRGLDQRTGLGHWPASMEIEKDY